MNDPCPIEFSYSFTHDAGYTVPPQWHTSYELVYYTEGVGTTVIGNRVFPIAPGTFTLIRPNTVHSEHHDTAGSVAFIVFRTEIPDELTDRAYSDPADTPILKLLTSMLEELQQFKRNYKRILSLQLQELVILIDRLCCDGERQKEDTIEYAVRYIHEYHSTPIDWQNLAQYCNYSYSHFRLIFKKATGCSPNEYLMHCRLNAAKRLLEQTTLSCTEIAYRCGFPSNAKFSTYFKDFVGISPKDHRKKSAQKPIE